MPVHTRAFKDTSHLFLWSWYGTNHFFKKEIKSYPRNLIILRVSYQSVQIVKIIRFFFFYFFLSNHIVYSNDFSPFSYPWSLIYSNK